MTYNYAYEVSYGPYSSFYHKANDPSPPFLFILSIYFRLCQKT